MPSIIDRSPVIVAISSSGGLPVLARWLHANRGAIAGRPGAGWAALAGSAPCALKTAMPDASQRRGFWERLLASPGPSK